MSQVRKLQSGNGGIPKTYDFQLDSQLYQVTDAQLKEIDDRIAKLDPNLKRFLGNWTNAIKVGGQQGNRAENAVSPDMVSGVEGRNMQRLESKKASFWESFLPTDSYYAKQAINEALGITASVLSGKPTETKTGKTVRYNRKDSFDYNTDAKGNKVYSNNPKNKFIEDRFDAYLDWLSDDAWGDTNEWETAIGANEPILKSWYNSYGDRNAAKAALDAAMNEVRTKPWDQISEQSRELLGYFNITDPTDAAKAVVGQEQDGAPLDENGKVDRSARTANGGYVVWKGTGKDVGKLFTNSTDGDEKPYLLNSDRLKKYGLGQDYLNGLVFRGQIYKPSEVSTNLELQDIMDRVVIENNSAKNTGEVWNNVGKLINFTDWEDSAVPYNYNTHYISYKQRALRDALGEGDYSIFDPSRNYELPEGIEGLYGVYDFNNIGDGTWGFRNPQYYILGNGTLTGPTQIPTDWNVLNRKWNTSAFPTWQNINGRLYGLVGEYWGSDGHDTTPYKIFEDQQGNFWTLRGDGTLQALEKELVDGIVNGTIIPNHNQMWFGTVSGKNPTTSNTYKITPGSTVYRRGFKQGGKVKLKPLPAKLQYGSKLGGAPLLSEAQETPMDTPLSTSSNLWETLTPADKKEITAAAVDIAGAIAGLAGPVGSIAGAATGIGISTPMFMSAAKERKGHLDAEDWVQAGLATGLDLVSLIPYLGETGKILKVGKAVSRVAVPLGKAFAALGLVEASSVLTKPYQDWDTNDLLKLSAGIQSVINIGHGLHVRRGESALAHEISSVAPKQKQVYSKKFKTKTGDVEIPLEDAQVKAITESNDPGAALKKILTDWGVADEELTDMRQVLRDFGFEVGRTPRLSKTWTTASEKPGEKSNYSKYGYIFDEVLDPFGTREIGRREYIDSKLGQASIREKINPKVMERASRTVANYPSSKERVTVESTSAKNSPMARAYVQSLARRGDVESSWVRKPSLNPEEKVTINRAPGAEAAIASGEGLPNVSEMAKTSSKKGLESINAFAQNEQSANIASGVAKAMGPMPTSKNDRAMRLGAEAISNKELIDYINDKETSYSDAVTFLMNLSERKRNSLLNAISKPGSGARAKKLRREYLKSKGVSNIFDKANATDFSARLVASQDAKRNNAKEAFNSAREIASNLVQLRESKDPMKTLTLLSRRKGFDQWVYDHPEEFREALEYAKAHGVYSKLSPKQRKQYDFKLGQLIEGKNLIFKKGGVLKAQGGMTIKASPFGKMYEDQITLAGYDDALTDYMNSINDWNLPPLNDDWRNPNFDDARASIMDAVGQTPVATATASTTAPKKTIGGNTRPIADKTKWVLPVISGLGYIENAISRRKYRDMDKKRIAARRFNKQPLHANMYSTNNAMFDRERNRLGQLRQSGLTGIATNDWTQYNAGLNQLQSQLDAKDRDIFDREASYTWNAEKENTGIGNQNNLWEITNSNENGDNNALIDSMMYNPDLEYILRGDQSRQNLRLEASNIISKDINMLKAYNKAQFDRDAKRTHLSSIESAFPGKVAEYNALDAATRLQFADIDDYIERTVAGSAAKLEEIRNREDAAEMEWIRRNGLNFNWNWLGGRTSPGTDIAYAKKGGYLRGSTRYTKEPDEEIWIDNNKATHNAVAKLSEATIKMSLRSLK